MPGPWQRICEKRSTWSFKVIEKKKQRRLNYKKKKIVRMAYYFLMDMVIFMDLINWRPGTILRMEKVNDKTFRLYS